MTVSLFQTRDIATCRALRRAVFIEEQGISEADDLDDQDDAAIHLLLTENQSPLGTARLLTGQGYLKIGRLCVLKSARGRGFGADLIRACVGTARGIEGITSARLGAQIHALGFYEKLGFTATGPEFDDAGIPHREMVLRL
jgi:predicted GNAT family N-acyltransferase